jgi:hypothetical protein
MKRLSAPPGRRIDMNGMSAETLRDVIAALTEQRKIVVAQGASFACHLIDLAIMELRLTVNDISEQELSVLCDRLEDDPVGSERVN